jgi:hypothetical protein
MELSRASEAAVREKPFSNALTRGDGVVQAPARRKSVRELPVHWRVAWRFCSHGQP